MKCQMQRIRLTHSERMQRAPRNVRIYPLIVLALLAAPFSPTASAASWWERLLESVTSRSEPADDSSAPTPPRLDIASGLREALTIGSERVVKRLGAADGFNLDPTIRIELPEQLQIARSWLDRIGMAGPIDDLEVRMNRAAETATPRARQLFVDAIRSMTIADARALLKGGDTAATDYLHSKMSEPLAADLQPVVTDSLADVGALQLLDAVMERYHAIPFAPPIELDVRDYVTRKTVDGIFLYLAEEEHAIRSNPAERTTELLRSVFKTD